MKKSATKLENSEILAINWKDGTTTKIVDGQIVTIKTEQ